MTYDLIKYAFSAGEISPKFIGRTDLEKYDLAVSLAYNFYVDYQGGLSTRPGTEFCDYIWKDHLPVMTFPFQYGPDIGNSYLMLFGDHYIRFMQDGAYVLEAAKEITDITTSPSPIVTCPNHGYESGDWIKIYNAQGVTSLNTKLLEVFKIDANRFSVSDPIIGWVSTAGDDPYIGGGIAQRVYTLESPYPADALALLKHHQTRNLIRLTHPDFPIHNLIRKSHADWEISPEIIGNNVPSPNQPSLTPSDSGDAGTGVVVTAVDRDGQESLPSPMALIENMIDYASTRGSLRITWNTMPDVAYYNVYRGNIVPNGDDVTKAMQLGYLGTVIGPNMVDDNIIPDFTASPPQYYNPFANGQIEFINVTNPGSGYNKNVNVSVSDPTGSGFRGVAIADSNGAIIGVKVIKGGEGYTNPTVVFSGGGGSGATAEAVVTPLTGNYPSVSTVFQQRQIYAASRNEPLTLWGSRPKQFNNFDVSTIVADNDSYEFTIESPDATPIKHLHAMRSGLLVLTNSGVWQLTAGANSPITPSQALADPQSFQGCSDVPPLQIDADLAYISGKGTTVRLLSYNDIFKVYSGQDISLLASHLFGPGKQIVDWVYAEEPYRLVQAVRSDGALLNLTIVKEQNIFAWTQAWTKGLFQTVTVLQEGLYDRTYTVVSRKINGVWRKYVERFSLRHFDHVEDAVCVDAALQLPATYPEATLTIEGNICTTSHPVFPADAAGMVIRGGGGKAIVEEVINSGRVRVTWLRPSTKTIPMDDELLPLESGEWTLDRPVTEIDGLAHLEGQEVAVLADGNVVEGLTVKLGKITLPHPATRVIVGLGYKCIARTLPPTSREAVIEHRRKSILGAFVRVNESRGLKVGRTLDKLYEARERTTEIMGEPIAAINGLQGTLIQGDWDTEGQTYLVQEYPLPSTILGLVLNAEIGD